MQVVKFTYFVYIMASSPDKEFDEEFDWVRIQHEMDQSKAADVGIKRLTRLMLMNPFVPIGKLNVRNLTSLDVT